MKKTLVLVLGLLVMGAWADDRKEIMQLLAGSGRVSSLRIDGPWAVYDWDDREAAGMGLLHKLDGRWIRVVGGGGVLGPQDIFVMGVPKQSLRILLDRPGSHLYSDAQIREAVQQGPHWIDQIRAADLRAGDLQFMSEWELTLMRNEIYAVHGRIFQDSELRAYFQQRPWYRPDPSFQESRLSARERRNAKFIADYQHR